MDITATAIILTIASVYMLVVPATLSTNNFKSHMVYKLLPVALAIALGFLAMIEFGFMVPA